jgi:hypothetical protein
MVFHDANASIFAMLHNLTIKSEIQCEIITAVDPLTLFNNYLPMLSSHIFGHGANQLPAIINPSKLESSSKVIGSCRASNIVKRSRDLLILWNEIIVFKVHRLNIYLIDGCPRDS